MSAARPVVQCHVCDTKRSLGLECLYVEFGNRHYIPWDCILHPREWECTVPCFFRKDFHHHGQLSSLLSNGKFLLPGDGVHTNLPILANRSILVPAKHLSPGAVSLHLLWCNKQIADWTPSSVVVPSTGIPLPAFLKFPKASFSCLFLFMFLRWFGTWFGLLAPFLGEKKKSGGGSAGCPHRAASWKFPSLEMSLCFFKAQS